MPQEMGVDFSGPDGPDRDVESEGVFRQFARGQDLIPDATGVDVPFRTKVAWSE